MDLIWGTSRRLTGAERRHSQEEYELLSADPELLESHSINLHSPLNGHPPRRIHTPRRKRCLGCISLSFTCTRRRITCFAVLIPILLTCGILLSGVPPRYRDIRTYERHLPQHNLTTHQGTKFVRFPDHLWGHGLNNILQEYLLLSYIAFTSNRSFVFEDYVWSHLPFPYTVYDFALRPTRIPLNAFISGPTAGGPMPGHDAPRAISSEFWELTCPPEKRHLISSADAPGSQDGSKLIEWWTEKLSKETRDCIQVSAVDKPVLDKFFFGGPQLLSVWDSLSSSPILSDFIWSPLIHSALSRNFALLQPASISNLYDFSSNSTLQGLIAVHLRRGDYKRHCPRLATWNSGYMGFNSFPGLVDKFNPPVTEEISVKGIKKTVTRLGDDGDASKETIEAYYMEHCLPTVEQVVRRLHNIRKENPGLKRVFVLTNAWWWWLNDLKSALKKDGWDDLASTLDIQLDSEQKYVGMAVDMAIAEKAEVFVGNGFSSLTANIVMLRMAKGLDVSSNRFL